MLIRNLRGVLCYLRLIVGPSSLLIHGQTIHRYKGSSHADVFGHLTNSSINKRSPFVSDEKDVIGGGCKWSLRKLQSW